MFHEWHDAAGRGDLPAVLALLASGQVADADLADEEGWTALHWAALEGRDDVVEALLAAGADPCLSAGGWTALHWAAEKGWLRVLRLLLEHGAPADERRSGGRWVGSTPLCLALQHGQVATAVELVEVGADLASARRHFDSASMYDRTHAWMQPGASPLDTLAAVEEELAARRLRLSERARWLLVAPQLSRFLPPRVVRAAASFL